MRKEIYFLFGKYRYEAQFVGYQMQVINISQNLDHQTSIKLQQLFGKNIASIAELENPNIPRAEIFLLNIMKQKNISS